MRQKLTALALCIASLPSFSQNVGIGTTTPNYPLTVQASPATLGGITQKNGAVEIGFWTSGSAAYIQTWSPHDLNFATNNGATRLTLANSSGYLGIGISLPTATVDVNGTFRLRGNGAAAGNILVSDALGNASWQPLGSAGGWSLVGNAGTNPAVNFLGTTDDQPLVFRQNNVYAGKFHYALRNYFIGNQAGANTTAPHNVAMGDSALFANVSGYSNVAIGRIAMLRGDSYFANVAVGDSTLNHLGEGDDGGNSLYSSQNTAVGAKALYYNQRGYNNTAVGFRAGYKMELGSNNSVLGAYAMNSSGSSEAYQSVAIGYHALDTVRRMQNTAVGAYALSRIKAGESNTAVGHSAMRNSDSCRYATAIGFSASAGLFKGEYNTALGAESSVGGTPLTSYATAVGAGATVNQSNSLVLGRIEGPGTTVGIGTSSPAHALDIQTNSTFGGKAQLRLHETENDFARLKFTTAASTAYWDVAAAPSNTLSSAALNFYFSGYGDVLNVRGDGNVGIGTSNPQTRLHLQRSNEVLRLQGASSYLTFYNSANTYIGYLWNRSDASIDLGTGFGSGLPVTISPGTSTAATFTAAGNVGIGTATPLQKLHVIGNICYTGSSAACSDIRYKTDFAPVQNALPALAQIHPIYYFWKKEYKDKGFTDNRQIGFSAQEIEALYPEMVQTDADGYKAVDYSRMTVVLLQAVKEQQTVIEKQQQLLDALEKRLSVLEKKQ